MFKQCLLAFIAASVLSIALPFAAAQDNPSNDQPAQGAHENGGWHHGPVDPAQRTKELTKELKLTSDQQGKVQDLLTTERTQMEALRQDESTPREDRRAKMMDIRKNTDTQVRALLDTNQQKKWDDMQAKREQMMGRHHGPPNGGSSQDAPPPAQQ